MLDGFNIIKGYSKGPFDYIFEKTFRFDYLAARVSDVSQYKVEVITKDNETPSNHEALFYNQKTIEKIDKFVNALD